MSEEEYAIEKRVWIKRRLEILDAIDIKLQEMKRMAEYALHNTLENQEGQKLNDNIKELAKEVQSLYEKDRYFYLDHQ